MSVAPNAWAIRPKNDWRVRDNLTLNLGLRWEVEAPMTEAEDRFVSGFDFDAAPPGLRERLLAPGPPVHRNVRVLEEVGAGFLGQTVLGGRVHGGSVAPARAPRSAAG